MAGSRRVPEGPAPDPAVQKLRIRYAKRGRMRFTSTRDFQRALERAVRRAGLPMAYSGGFHPHPKISYANAAPTGAASEAEYVEISLTRVVDPAAVAPVLDASLPEGLDVIEVVDAADLPGALADRLQGSVWGMRFLAARGEAWDAEGMARAVASFLAVPELHVPRMMKKGPRDLDVRAAVLDLAVADTLVPGVEADPDGGDVVLLASLLHTTPTVRPEEVWTALRQVSGLDLPRPVSTRLRQGPVVDGTVAETLDDGSV
ncbi:TIGR03936 family radical SAM-associated protein [Ornithinimicrobium tianjinense]|uniref:Radical SAM protein n=1 Tax=Ornithinimicrobium tianjinense TaxID=1195761 RepID=A0A917BNA4_9MICO|nr:TIGR03936 family radical SAM-associated protein [Ornithinimicrobium tianjinense]GGF49725.1 radical SAM protein [Ornithinimicrobium tianjinense]